MHISNELRLIVKFDPNQQVYFHVQKIAKWGALWFVLFAKYN
jgi:hypothetical protein